MTVMPIPNWEVGMDHSQSSRLFLMSFVTFDYAVRTILEWSREGAAELSVRVDSFPLASDLTSNTARGFYFDHITPRDWSINQSNSSQCPSQPLVHCKRHTPAQSNR